MDSRLDGARRSEHGVNARLSLRVREAFFVAGQLWAKRKRLGRLPVQAKMEEVQRAVQAIRKNDLVDWRGCMNLCFSEWINETWLPQLKHCFSPRMIARWSAHRDSSDARVAFLRDSWQAQRSEFDRCWSELKLAVGDDYDSTEQLLTTVLLDPTAGLSQLYRYMAASVARLPIADDLEPGAILDYALDRQAFDSVLGEKVPASLREKLDKEAAWSNQL